MDYQARLDSILRQVIRRGFPELQRMRIALAIGEYDDWMYYEPVGEGRGTYVIGVDKALRDAPRRAIAGCFAHELAHIVRESRMGRWRLDRAWDLYFSSRTFRECDERATDTEAVARGYGRELLALMVYGRVRRYRWDREDGLTFAEVHRLVARTLVSAAPRLVSAPVFKPPHHGILR